MLDFDKLDEARDGFKFKVKKKEYTLTKIPFMLMKLDKSKNDILKNRAEIERVTQVTDKRLADKLTSKEAADKQYEKIREMQKENSIDKYYEYLFKMLEVLLEVNGYEYDADFWMSKLTVLEITQIIYGAMNFEIESNSKKSKKKE